MSFQEIKQLIFFFAIPLLMASLPIMAIGLIGYGVYRGVKSVLSNSNIEQGITDNITNGVFKKRDKVILKNISKDLEIKNKTKNEIYIKLKGTDLIFKGVFLPRSLGQVFSNKTPMEWSIKCVNNDIYNNVKNNINPLNYDLEFDDNKKEIKIKSLDYNNGLQRLKELHTQILSVRTAETSIINSKDYIYALPTYLKGNEKAIKAFLKDHENVLQPIRVEKNKEIRICHNNRNIICPDDSAREIISEDKKFKMPVGYTEYKISDIIELKGKMQISTDIIKNNNIKDFNQYVISNLNNFEVDDYIRYRDYLNQSIDKKEIFIFNEKDNYLLNDNQRQEALKNDLSMLKEVNMSLDPMSGMLYVSVVYNNVNGEEKTGLSSIRVDNEKITDLSDRIDRLSDKDIRDLALRLMPEHIKEAKLFADVNGKSIYENNVLKSFVNNQPLKVRTDLDKIVTSTVKQQTIKKTTKIKFN